MSNNFPLLWAIISHFHLWKLFFSFEVSNSNVKTISEFSVVNKLCNSLQSGASTNYPSLLFSEYCKYIFFSSVHFKWSIQKIVPFGLFEFLFNWLLATQSCLFFWFFEQLPPNKRSFKPKLLSTLIKGKKSKQRGENYPLKKHLVGNNRNITRNRSWKLQIKTSTVKSVCASQQ